MELESLQAHRCLDIGGIAESMLESCLLAENHVSLHHIFQDFLTEMRLFDGKTPEVHDKSLLAEYGFDFFIDFAQKVLLQLDNGWDKVQIIHEMLVEALRNLC